MAILNVLGVQLASIQRGGRRWSWEDVLGQAAGSLDFDTVI